MKNLIRAFVFLHLCFLLTGCEPPTEYRFTGIEGPNDLTEPVPFQEASFEKYGKGLPSRMAILINAEPAHWLSLAHALKTIGIPFLVTKDPNIALKHKVVFVYPAVSAKNWSKDILVQLRKFVFQGGTLIASPVEDTLKDVFGFQSTNFSYDHTALYLNDAADINRIFTEPEERSLQWKNTLHYSTAMSLFRMWSYSTTSAETIASYENKKPAIILNHLGKGRALSFGFDLGDFLTSCYAFGANVWETRYANHFIPTLDVFLRMIKEMYVTGNPDAVTIGTVPNEKSLAVMFTHDVTSENAVNNILAYAEYEAKVNIPSTYFMVTKYISDYNEAFFFDSKAVEILTKAASLGMEIASHTVSHSRQFYKMPIGTGWEKYPTYRPIIKNRRVTLNGSILGELRVSKFLLETLVDHAQVTSFRAGYLLKPHALPQALDGTGYLYDSNGTANTTWSHLPFQLNYCFGSAGEVNIFEFPITFEDMISNIASRSGLEIALPKDIAVAKKIARYGGNCVILIHPDIVGTYLEYEQRFIEAVKDFSWFGTLQEFGNWWAARNEIELDIVSSGDNKIISLQVPKPIKGMNLMLPEGWKCISATPETLKISQDNRKLIIEESAPAIKLVFTLSEIACAY